MVESTIDKIKDITVERQIRKLAGIIDEQNDTISKYGDATTDIQNLKDSDANQTNQINNLKSDVAKNTTATENLNNRVTSVEQDITNTESEITSVKSTITDIQSKDVEQDGTLANHATLIQGITESLVSDVQILDGITTGDIKVRIDREDAASIDSNSYNLGLPVSAEIIQGTGPSMFKVQITMSSGVKVVSNDFVFTTEAIGTDVYISSFTFKAGSQDGYLSADIGLNNGVTIEANNFLVPTDPNVIANITDLQTRMTNVENTTSDERITAIETKNTEQDTAIQKNATDINSLNTEVSGVMSDLDTKADLTNTSQTIKADTTDLRTVKLRDSSDVVSSYLQFNASGNKPVKMEYFNGSEVVDSGYIATVDDSGNPKNFTIPSGGEVWEEVDLSNFPTDWVVGDEIKITTKLASQFGSTIIVGSYWSYVIQFRVTNTKSRRVIYDNSGSVIYGLMLDSANLINNLPNADILTFYIINVANTNDAGNVSISVNNLSNYTESLKMWRLKK